MSGQPVWIAGPIERVPCPHCSKTMDMRDLRDQNLLDTGKMVECDFCKRWSEICAIQPVTMISLRRTDSAGALAATSVQRRQLKG